MPHGSGSRYWTDAHRRSSGCTGSRYRRALALARSQHRKLSRIPSRPRCAARALHVQFHPRRQEAPAAHGALDESLRRRRGCRERRLGRARLLMDDEFVRKEGETAHGTRDERRAVLANGGRSAR
eukprot:5508527-Prymnesium_polylepis.1